VRLSILQSPCRIGHGLYKFIEVVVRRTGAKRLDELVERGYNTLRIDVFPHMLAPSLSGSTETVFRLLSYFGRYWSWGSEFTLDIEP